MIPANSISWFEIPATDIDRAQKFYENILGIAMIAADMPALKMRIFPIENRMGISGAVTQADGFYKPSATDGPLVYLNANPDVQTVLDRVPAAGGEVLVPKTEISPENGFMGIIKDSEGNRIGLHSVPLSML